jgi:phosphoribosylanthranilate isomerase
MPLTRPRFVAAGITSSDDAWLCATEGADGVAVLVDYPPMPTLRPWNISRDRGARVLRDAPPYLIRVGVVGGDATQILQIAETVRPHVLELQANEPTGTVRDVVAGLAGSGVTVTKVFLLRLDGSEYRVPSPAPQSPAHDGPVDWRTEVERYLDAGAESVMFDIVPGTADLSMVPPIWSVIAEAIAGQRRPVGLQGGLVAGNVADAVRAVRPQVVNAIKDLEIEPGRKDRERVRAFITALSSGQ